MEEWPVTTVVASLGFGLGLIFGATAQRTNFCTMGAISDIVFLATWNRFRAWLLAIAVAMLGSQMVFALTPVDPLQSVYLAPEFTWLSVVLGGLLFGFGMTLTGGCGNKTLVRLGAGNLKSLVVAVFLGIFAYMTLRGLTGLARLELNRVATLDLAARGLESQGIAELLVYATALDAVSARFAVAGVFVTGLLWFCFMSRDFRNSHRDVTAGLVIGALVPAAWYVTGVLGADDFEPTPLSSFTFVAPIGESIQYLMTFTGSTVNFGIAAVGGVIAGSFVAAVATRSFRVETFHDGADLVRHLVGSALMGIGGVLALGCTIGQGITGMSTLALGSLTALLAIVAGGVCGMKYLEHDGFAVATRALLGRQADP